MKHVQIEYSIYTSIGTNLNMGLNYLAYVLRKEIRL